MKYLYSLLVVGLLLVITAGVYLNQPQFDAPDEPPTHLAKAAVNAIYDGKKFHNTRPIQVLTEKTSQAKALFDFLFKKDPGGVPDGILPSEKTDLKQLDPADNLVVWMGHSTIFIQLDGQTFLFDPVFSDNASPVPHTNVAFTGSNIYQAEDMPAIDYLLISHDHWDHLDYATVHALQDKVRQVVVPLGVGSYFRQWGYNPEIIHELDWHSNLKDQSGLTIEGIPSQHFSGRMLKKDQTLWTSYALISPTHRIFISGDTGYGPQFKDAGNKFGPFDLAILEDGQYNKAWAHIHMFPEQVAQAAVDLKARALMPEHNSKFKEARHPWKGPLQRLTQASQGKPYQLWTPMMGQRVNLDKPNPQLSQWWKSPLAPLP